MAFKLRAGFINCIECCLLIGNYLFKLHHLLIRFSKLLLHRF